MIASALKHNKLIYARRSIKPRVIPFDSIIETNTILPKYLESISKCSKCLDYIPPANEQAIILQKMHLAEIQTDISNLEPVFLELFIKHEDAKALDLLEHLIEYNNSLDYIRNLINS